MSLVGKLATVAKDYSKMGALIGQSKSGVKVYKTSMQGGLKTIHHSFDNDGKLIKKVVTETSPLRRSTQVYDGHNNLVRKSIRDNSYDDPFSIRTTKFDKDGGISEALAVDCKNKKVKLQLNDGEKAVVMGYNHGQDILLPQFSVECGEKAINDIYKGIDDVTLPHGTFDIIETSGCEGLRGHHFSSIKNGEFAEILYNTFKKIFKMVEG